jgi:hypothetical protein
MADSLLRSLAAAAGPRGSLMSAKFRLTRNAYGFPPTRYSLRGQANLTRTPD